MARHPDRIGILDQASGRADRTGHVDADGALAAGFALNRADNACDGFNRGGVVAARGWEASRDVVRSSQGNCFDLRTADINADPHAALPRTRPPSSAEQ
jgi:hypothetical protein